MRGKGRVFVFDDDADSLQSVVAALRRDGFDVFPFADPREGLARVEGEGGDVVVTDSVGADDYVLKPFDLDEISARLRALERENRELRKANEILKLASAYFA